MTEVVETASGRISGREHKGVRLFRGIPFARAPSGGRRFRPPEPPQPWPGVREMLEAGPACPQPTVAAGRLGRLLPSASRTDEDCLSLNVWTPGLDRARRPVLVWIHGGAFVLGAGSGAVYSGRRLARRGDAVVVTINYRLGALGFLQMTDVAGPEGPFASNLGIRDQIAALRWVRENIEAFGGDAGNVTVFGESAGAMSVGTLLGCPAARGLFQRAVLQSGAAHNVSSRETAARVAEAFLVEFGLSAATAERLRWLPVSHLLSAQRRVSLKLGLGHGTLPWQPAVDCDLLAEPPLDAIARGLSKDVPILIGTNRDEWKLFLLGDRKARRMDHAALLRRLSRALPGEDAASVAYGQRALEVYRRSRTGRGPVSPLEIWAAFQSDRIFRYPATRLAELQGRHQPKTYAYLFDWSPRLLRRRIGACHAIEIPLLFGTLRHPLLRPIYGPGRAVRELSRTLQRTWIRFARSGEPNHGGLAEWPAYEAPRRATMVLGHPSFAEDAPLDAERRFWAELDAEAR